MGPFLTGRLPSSPLTSQPFQPASGSRQAGRQRRVVLVEGSMEMFRRFMIFVVGVVFVGASEGCSTKSDELKPAASTPSASVPATRESSARPNLGPVESGCPVQRPLARPDRQRVLPLPTSPTRDHLVTGSSPPSPSSSGRVLRVPPPMGSASSTTFRPSPYCTSFQGGGIGGLPGRYAGNKPRIWPL